MFKGAIESGILIELRDLKTKNGEVWRTIAKIAFVGGLVEAIVPSGMHCPPSGSTVHASGKFISQKTGAMDFELEEIDIA